MNRAREGFSQYRRVWTSSTVGHRSSGARRRTYHSGTLRRKNGRVEVSYHPRARFTSPPGERPNSRRMGSPQRCYFGRDTRSRERTGSANILASWPTASGGSDGMMAVIQHIHRRTAEALRTNGLPQCRGGSRGEGGRSRVLSSTTQIRPPLVPHPAYTTSTGYKNSSVSLCPKSLSPGQKRAEGTMRGRGGLTPGHPPRRRRTSLSCADSDVAGACFESGEERTGRYVYQ